MLLVITSFQAKHLCLLFFIERTSNHMVRGAFKTMISSITAGTNGFGMLQLNSAP